MSEPRPGIDRRSVLRGLGLAAATPLVEPLLGLPGYHAQVPSVEADRRWSPRYLTPAEIETGAALAECILPETDTPGARAALVHQYVDWVLSQEERDRAAMRNGIGWLDRVAGGSFASVAETLQMSILGSVADPEGGGDRVGRDLFNAAKRLTIRGYYRSAIGMHQELGYDGNKHLSRFEGCIHPEHQSWRPATERDV